MLNGPIPHYIEPYKSVDRNIVFEGDISLTDLPRLREALATDNAIIHAKVSLQKGKQQQVFMVMTLTAKLELICQRCIEVMAFLVEETYNYMFLASEQDEVLLPEGFDTIELGPKEPFDLKVLIEDELLLALPIIATHDLKACQQPVTLVESELIEDEVQRSNPFSILAQLKRDPKA